MGPASFALAGRGVRSSLPRPWWFPAKADRCCHRSPCWHRNTLRPALRGQQARPGMRAILGGKPLAAPRALHGRRGSRWHGQRAGRPQATSPVLVLGTLPPGADVTVFAWTRLEVLSRFSTQEIRLAHRDGYGDVSVEMPTGRLGQWVERIGPIGFGLFAGLIAILAGLLFMESVAHRNQKVKC